METRRSSLRLPWSLDESPIQPSTQSNAKTTTTTTTLTGETQISSQPSNINSISRNSPYQVTTRPKIGQRPSFRPALSPKNRESRKKSQSPSPSQPLVSTA
uniref:Uncharacterized protein n=1 Tax=Solanum lycopersicum TaxID=4081 RepID=A0A3Q7I3V8_SOLLC